MVRKYLKKQARRLKGYVKQRYAPTGRVDIGKVVSDLSYVKSVLNVERKYKDTISTGFNTPAAGGWTVVRLNNLTQGSGISDRDGAQIRMKSLQMAGRIKRSDTALSTVKQERVRMMVFMDKEPLTSGAGNTPAILDILNAGTVDSLKNWSCIQERRIKVLLDRTYKVDQDDGEKLIKVYKKLGARTTWLPNSALANDINNNALYVAFWTDSPSAVATERPLVSHQFRLTYVDN